MSEAAAWLVVLVATALGVIPVVYVARDLRRHLDPSRAAVVAEADGEGRFTLEIPPGPEPVAVYVRLLGDEGPAPDAPGVPFACGARFRPRASYRAPVAVEWSRGRRAPRLDFAPPGSIGALEARTEGGGSFFLLEVPAGGGRLEGRVVRADGPPRRAWVYVA